MKQMDPDTPLYWAARAGDRAEVRRLLAAGARVDAERPKDGSTSLHAAAMRGDADLIELLVAAGGKAVLNAFDELNRTPLIEAVEADAPDAVQLLLEAGADIDARNEARIGETALHHAVRNGNIAMVRRLLDAGANPLVQGWMRLTPLDLADDPKLHGHRQMRVLLRQAHERRGSLPLGE